MKKIFAFAAALIVTAALYGQAPSSFKYQAVLRDSRGNLKAKVATVISIDIIKGSAAGTSVYSETHNVTTDSYGIINLEVGKGTVVTGTLGGIDWGADSYYIKVKVDGLEMGTSQLLSVPYALYATKAANVFSGDYEDLSNKPSLFDGVYSSLTGKPALTVVATTGNYSDLTNKPTLFDGKYGSLSEKPVLSTVATSGSYDDLSNKPAIPNGTVTSITGTNPVNVADGTTTPVISMAKAGSTTDGYLGSTDWTTFNNKSSFDGTWLSLAGKPAFATVATSGSYNDLTNKPATVTEVTGTDPVTVASGTTTPVISMAKASSTVNGYLSSTDWTTFNNKSTFNGTWASLTGKPTFAVVATTGNYLDLSNRPLTNGSETKVTAGDNISVTGTGTSAAPYVISNGLDGSETIINSGTNITVTGTGTSGNPYEINTTAHTLGEEYGGGIVFYVYDGGQHGLIAAKEDLFGGGQYGDAYYFRWFNIACPEGCYFIESGVKGDGLGAGAMNTTLIVASQVSYAIYTSVYPMENFAAKACADYEVTIDDITIGDWYLPSKYELDLLYSSQVNIATLNLSADDYYWSSIEFDSQYACYEDFSDGSTWDDGYKLDWTARVRPIRAF